MSALAMHILHHGRICGLAVLLLWPTIGCGQSQGEISTKNKIKAEEVETRTLRLLQQGGTYEVLTQETSDSAVQTRRLNTTWLSDHADLLWPWTPAVVRQKRIMPRRVQVLVTGEHVTFPGPAEADRILLQIPETLSETTVLQIALPLPPGEGQAALEPDEGMVLRVESLATYRVQWDSGYVMAAGLSPPDTLDNHSYFRLEYDGHHWLLIAMTAARR